MQNFSHQLRKQLGYINTSAREFDNGEEDEGIRIAVALRVIFHDKNQNISLLSHLQGWHVEMRTQKEAPFTTTTSTGYALTSFGYAPEGGLKAYPKINPMIPVSYLGAMDWWTEEVLVADNYRLTRRDLALMAADNDGGTHVDKKLKPAYIEFQTRMKKLIGLGPETISPILATLRTMGFEVLSSPTLLAIVGSAVGSWHSNKRWTEIEQKITHLLFYTG